MLCSSLYNHPYSFSNFEASMRSFFRLARDLPQHSLPNYKPTLQYSIVQHSNPPSLPSNPSANTTYHRPWISIPMTFFATMTIQKTNSTRYFTSFFLHCTISNAKGTNSLLYTAQERDTTKEFAVYLVDASPKMFSTTTSSVPLSYSISCAADLPFLIFLILSMEFHF